MPTTRPRRLAVTAALALGIALAPTSATVAGAASGLATPTTPPPPPGPPVGPGGVTTKLPLLSIELDDAVEIDGAVPGRLTLSSAVAEELAVTVDMDAGFDHSLTVYIPAGATEASFLYDIAENDGPEDAQVIGASIDSVLPVGRVRIGPADGAVLYDGAGLEITMAEGEPQALEGDAGSDGTLAFEVVTNQAVPHPVTFHVRTGIIGGYNGGVPGLDYQAVDEVVELPAGETSLSFEVPLIGDDLNEEPHELLTGHVSDPSHGAVVIAESSRLARILDDDGPVVTWERPGDYQSSSRSARSAAFTA